MQINRRQDYMVQQFEMIAKPYDGDERFHVYDMTDGKLNFGTVSDSILESIDAQLKATNDYLNNPGSKPNRCIELWISKNLGVMIENFIEKNIYTFQNW